MKITLDHEQQLFVEQSNAGYTCLGFEIAHSTARYIAERLGRPDLNPSDDEYGSLAGYGKYRAAVVAWGASAFSVDTWFDPGTPEEVKGILERYRHNGKLLRLFYGDAATGRDWCEENDVVGRVGRSTGTFRVPLLIPLHDTSGGPAISTRHVVRLMDGLSGRELYRHPTYAEPELVMRPTTDEKMRSNGLAWEVLKADQIHSRFASAYEAAEYVEFITGRSAARRQDLFSLAKQAPTKLPA